MADRRIRVAVVFGGRSGEHDVSCSSAASIVTHLDRERYEVLAVRIAPDGEWIIGEDVPGTASGSGSSSGTAGPGPTGRSAAAGMGEALVALREADVVFPALHGPYGEDGTIQAMLEFEGIPYVGNGVLASSAGMDKDVTKKLLRAAGLRVARGVMLRGDQSTIAEADKQRLGLPVYVKPARAGSSLGVSKVDSWDQLDAALSLAREQDPKVVIEEAIGGREIDLGLLQYPDGRVEVGPALEIFVGAGHEFFDFAAKYGDTSDVFKIPADLDPGLKADLADRAVRAFHALECRGLLRVDFFVPETGEPVLNEVNTFPGFTAMSQYPRMWAAAGLGYGALLDVMIDTALQQTPARAPSIMQ
ncbi:MAG TPA: D-alanine--D-alanine ligase family protein [Pilimelia sp.]|nr:D-alanine--D-alanine ligase family protein [Pilimelia sp.]